jgi:hypothetical protein
MIVPLTLKTTVWLPLQAAHPLPRSVRNSIALRNGRPGSASELTESKNKKDWIQLILLTIS